MNSIEEIKTLLHRNKLRLDLYNDNESRTKVIWTTQIDTMLSDAHKVIKITNK